MKMHPLKSLVRLKKINGLNLHVKIPMWIPLGFVDPICFWFYHNTQLSNSEILWMEEKGLFLFHTKCGKKTNKKTKQKSVAHLKLSFYSLEPFCLSMSCRRHCPPPKNGVEHRYLVTLESSIDSSSLSQPLRSKPDMQQSTFDTSRRLVIKHFHFHFFTFHNHWCHNSLRSKPDMQQTFDTRRLVIKHFLFDEQKGHKIWTRWTKKWQQISQDILRERFWQLCSLCIWISLYNYRREWLCCWKTPSSQLFYSRS